MPQAHLHTRMLSATWPALLAVCLAACGSIQLGAVEPIADSPNAAVPAADSNTVLDAPAAQESNSTNPANSPNSTEPNATVPSTTAPTPAKPLVKRGICSGEQVSPALSPQDLTALSPNVSWWYNWSYKPASQALIDTTAQLGMEYVPMVFTAPFNANAIIASILPGSRYLLTFNEPNFKEQGNLTPQQAASYWPEIERIARSHNLAIVSPALNFCGGACNETSPTAWLDAFFAACPGCRVDYIALHAYVCYGSALTSVYLEPFYKRYGKRIWLTEFSCLDGSAPASDANTQLRYMQEAVTRLEADPHVMRYAWFLARTGPNSNPLGLLAGSGVTSTLGKAYKSLPANNNDVL